MSSHLASTSFVDGEYELEDPHSVTTGGASMDTEVDVFEDADELPASPSGQRTGPGGYQPANQQADPRTTATSSSSTSSSSTKDSEPNPFELGPSELDAAVARGAVPPPQPSENGGAASSAAAAVTAAHLSSETWAQMFWATASNKQRLQQFCYSHAFPLSVATQILMIILFQIVEPTAIKYQVAFSPFMAFLLIACELFQLFIIVCAHLGMARELTALYVRPGKIWNMYMSTCLAFAAIYFTFFCFQRSSFQVDGYAATGKDDVDYEDPDQSNYEDLQTANDIPTIFIYFCYFSGAIMTSTGFGDIAPTLWYSQALSNSQMLLGTMYHVGVFGLTLSHFRTFQKVSEAQEALDLAEGRVSRTQRCWNWFTAFPIVAQIRAHRYTAIFKRFCIKYLVVVCVIFQTLNTMLLLSIPDPFRALTPADGARYRNKVVVLTFITLFQTAMFIGVMYISIRLVKKINNADITPGFLIQSFLATALLFGGIYFVLFAATPNHQFSHHDALHLTVFEVLYVFVHFSLTVMTTTGFGDVYARGIIARCFVLVQMLISILYSAVIIGLGTSQLIDMQAARAESEFKAKEQARLEAASTSSHARQAVDLDAANPFDHPTTPATSSNAASSQTVQRQRDSQAQYSEV